MISRHCQQMSCSRRSVALLGTINSSNKQHVTQHVSKGGLHLCAAYQPCRQPTYGLGITFHSRRSGHLVKLCATADEGSLAERELLTVVTTCGSLFDLEVIPGTTSVGSLRSTVANRMEWPTNMVRLAYRGRELPSADDNQVFMMQPGVTVLSAQKRPTPSAGSQSSAPTNVLTVHTMEGKKFTLRVTPGTTRVREIRREVATATSISPAEVRLHYAGKELDPALDDRIMEFKKLNPQSTALNFIMHTMKRMQGGANAPPSQPATVHPASSRRRRRADGAKPRLQGKKPSNDRTILHSRSAAVTSIFTPVSIKAQAGMRKPVSTPLDAAQVFNDIDKSANVMATAPVTAPGAGCGQVEAQLAKQFRDLMKHPIPGVSVAPDEDNTMKWHVQLAGPEGSPYAGGWFHVVLYFSNNFPGVKPKIEWRTMTWHPNIEQCGRVCIGLEERVCSVGCVLSALQQLLSHPNYTSPLNHECARQMELDPRQYWENAQQYTLKYAM